MQKYNYISKKNDDIINYLNIYIPNNLISIISEYMDGFVDIGRLDDEIFRGCRFIKNYISYKIKYIHHNELCFIDFWELNDKEYNNIYYPSGWWVKHHMFILSFQKKKLLYDKITFFIKMNGTNLDNSDADYPLYDTNLLKKEYFETYDINNDFINEINTLLKLFENENSFDQKQLFKLLIHFIRYPVETDDVNTKNSIAYITDMENYYDEITLPFIL